MRIPGGARRCRRRRAPGIVPAAAAALLARRCSRVARAAAAAVGRAGRRGRVEVDLLHPIIDLREEAVTKRSR